MPTAQPQACHPLFPQDTDLTRQPYSRPSADCWGPDRPYGTCSEDMEPRIHLENCVHDLYATGGSRETLCAVLGSYAQECQ
ncbi:hypothetical protein J1605_004227 [Eschrichtius robustus]|uniref:VWF/SSPO/Zonadhesin-like cysteine-rich domain-containing protein n=1 Tax=Eschrichtius robustus TaxID=9764 RepID=A0AB34HJW5_ESCRO|nr:hypothetical protein J1605_004227 [Eschrichtius robustus]